MASTGRSCGGSAVIGSPPVHRHGSRRGSSSSKAGCTKLRDVGQVVLAWQDCEWLAGRSSRGSARLRATRSGAAASLAPRAKAGGAERDRTADLLIANEALSQLSYSPNGTRAGKSAGARVRVSRDRVSRLSMVRFPLGRAAAKTELAAKRGKE